MSEHTMTVPCPPGYESLLCTLLDAYRQATEGKGRERHAGKDEQFEKQPIFWITDSVGIGFLLGQAMKKILESQRLEPERGTDELLGAIIYLAAAVMTMSGGRS